jgi:hypothetical protein
MCLVGCLKNVIWLVLALVLLVIHSVLKWVIIIGFLIFIGYLIIGFVGSIFDR